MQLAKAILACFIVSLPVSAHAHNAPKNVESRDQQRQTRQTIPQALAIVHEKYKVNVVAELYPSSPGTDSGVSIRVADSIKTTGPELLKEIANQSGRDLIVLGDVYVLRHRKAIQLGVRAAKSGPVILTPPDMKITSLGLKYEDASLPARKVDVDVSGNTVAEFVAALQKTTHLNVHADKALENRYVCVLANDVTPATVLNALGTLLDAGPEIILRGTDAQSQLAKDLEYSGNEGFAKRMGLSRELYAATSKLLTAEQVQQRQNGQFAEIPLSSLSPDLQKSALDYIKFSANQAGSLVSSPDMSKWQEFALRFGPPRSGPPGFLGITIVGSDGTEYSF